MCNVSPSLVRSLYKCSWFSDGVEGVSYMNVVEVILWIYPFILYIVNNKS